MDKQGQYLVIFDPEAVWEWQRVKGAEERNAVKQALKKLTLQGPKIGTGHMKALKGTRGVLEIRPRAGHSAFRLLVARAGNLYVVLAVANKKNFDRALVQAQVRLRKYGNGIIK